MLRFRSVDDDAIELVAHSDLAGKARVLGGAIRKLEHFPLRIRGGTDLAQPVRSDMNVTGAAGRATATIPIDSRNLIVDRAPHQRLAFGQLDGVTGAVVRDVCDSSHVSALLPECVAQQWAGEGVADVALGRISIECRRVDTLQRCLHKSQTDHSEHDDAQDGNE